MTIDRFGIKFDRERATEMSCVNANCEQNAKGWFSVLDVDTEDGAWMAAWIKERSGRRFYEWLSETALEEALRRQTSGDLSVTPELTTFLGGLRPGLVVFAFPAGQRCFRQHLDREVVFKGRGYTFEKPREWNEAWNDSAYKVNEAKKRG